MFLSMHEIERMHYLNEIKRDLLEKSYVSVIFDEMERTIVVVETSLALPEVRGPADVTTWQDHYNPFQNMFAVITIYVPVGFLTEVFNFLNI